MAARKMSALQRPGGDSSRGYIAPAYGADMAWRSIGSSGLRQYGGWVREEFLPQLRGRQAARTYREMQDNSPTVGAILFAIQQSMRQVTWRVDAQDSKPQSAESVAFVESCMNDMAQGWPDFVSETLSMLPYGFAPHEIVYKRRSGNKQLKPSGPIVHSSKYDDGRVGWAKLALRGQETVIKWFFNDEGDWTGLTQQPWFGGTINIPAEKLLLFRPRAHKGSPEGTSILRTAYRSWWFQKRLEEQEGVALERMSGTPEYRVPNVLLEGAANNDPLAVAALEQFKRIVTNIKIDEQMGLVTPSDCYQNADGTISNVPMYEFKYNVPQNTGRGMTAFGPAIDRHKLDIMTSVLADFLMLGHGSSSRGAQTLGEAKVDLFFQATEGWLDSDAAVLNDHGLPRLWELNGFHPDTMPRFAPDMPQRVDLDALSNFIVRMSQAGARLFPDDDLENYLRDIADLPELTDDMLNEMMNSANPDASEDVQKHVAGMMARRLSRKGFMPLKSKTKSRRGNGTAA